MGRPQALRAGSSHLGHGQADVLLGQLHFHPVQREGHARRLRVDELILNVFPWGATTERETCRRGVNEGDR